MLSTSYNNKLDTKVQINFTELSSLHSFPNEKMTENSSAKLDRVHQYTKRMLLLKYSKLFIHCRLHILGSFCLYTY